MTYHGDIRLGDTIDIKFTTRALATGAPTSLSGGTVAAYVGNGTTEITAGVTLTADFDSRTGLNNVRVVASSGNGFATASDVQLVLTAGTVGGTSVVGEVVGSFSIEDRSALMPTTATRTLDVSSTGEAGIDWANVGSPTTSLNLSGTTISTSQVVASVSGAVGSVSSGGITAASVAIGAIDADALATDAVTEIADAILRAALTESYSTDGAAPTLTQALLLVLQILSESSVAGTTLTVKKLDGSTTAATFTLNDATTPTSITRTT